MKFAIETWEKFSEGSEGFPKVPCKIGTEGVYDTLEIAEKRLKQIYKNQQGICIKTKECDKSYFYEDNPNAYHYWFEIKEVE